MPDRARAATDDTEGNALLAEPKPAPVVPVGDLDTDTAVKAYRDTASWITKAFVAIAGVLVGSGPVLTQVSDVHGARLVWVVLGIAIAVAGAGLVVWSASAVTLPQSADLAGSTEAQAAAAFERVKHLLGRSNLTTGVRSLSDLLNERTKMAGYYGKFQVVPVTGGNATAKEAARTAALEKMLAQMSFVDEIIGRIQGLVVLEKVKEAFNAARMKMFVGAGVVLVGALIFVAAIGSSSNDDGDTTSPDIRSLNWAGNGATSTFREQIRLDARGCNSPLPVRVHGGEGTGDDPFDLEVLPTSRCPVGVRFKLQPGLGNVVEFTPFEIKVADEDGAGSTE